MSSRATKTGSAFRRRCAIQITIDASPERIWALLTNAGGFPTWNSTVTRIEGEITDGNRLQITVPAAPNRVFTPTVSDVQSERAMTWSDGFAPLFRGVRQFTLTPHANGSTEFFMSEELSGLMLPMIKGSLPDFVPVFETYAADLKRAAEERS